MATKLYLKSPLSSWNSAYGYASLAESILALVTSVTNTTASGTKIQATKTGAGTLLKWISPPLAAAVTISGTVTFNLWAKEAAIANNAGIRMELFQYTAGAESGTAFAAASFGSPTELTTTMAVKNWTVAPTSTSFAIGDRIVAYIYVVNVGTMGAGTPGVTVDYGGPTNAADGDSWFQLTEAVSFQKEGEFIQDVRSALNTSLVLPSTVTGNLITVSVFWNDTTSTCTLSDGANTFTQIGSRQTIGANSQAFFYAKNITGGSRTIAASLSNSPTAVIITGREYAGLDTSSPLDVASPATGTGSGTSLATGNLVTTSPNEMLIATAGADGASADINVGTGYIKRNVDAAGGDLSEDKSVTATGTYTATGTATVTGNWAISLAGFLWASQPNATVAVTGQQISSSKGATTEVASLSLTGQQIASSEGSTSETAQLVLSGQQATSSRGTTSQNASTGLSLTGQQIAISEGTTSEIAQFALSGQQVTVSQGTSSQGSSLSLTGQQIATSEGTTSETAKLALSGQQIVTSEGASSEIAQLALSGQQVTSSEGSTSQSTSTSLSLTGQQIISSEGTTSETAKLALSGQQVTSSQGAATQGSKISLTGQQIAISEGTTSETAKLALSGQQLTISEGSTSQGAGLSVSLTGQQIAASEGTTSEIAQLALSGQQVTGSEGTPSLTSSLLLTGQQIGLSETDTLQVISPVLSGQQISPSVGTVTTSLPTIVNLTGLLISSFENSSSEEARLALTGNQITAQVGIPGFVFPALPYGTCTGGGIFYGLNAGLAYWEVQVGTETGPELTGLEIGAASWPPEARTGTGPTVTGLNIGAATWPTQESEE